jgi:DNA-binding XRE family transcriptional regulator
VPKQTIQNYQIRVYMNARDLGLSQTDAASIAEFSERTGQRIEAGTHQPNRGRVRDWRTSADPLVGIWEEAQRVTTHFSSIRINSLRK